jgi:hypothetical protein
LGSESDIWFKRYFGCKALLGIIVAEIQVHTRTAVICYALPLPGDSPLAGMRRQEIDLPEEALAWWTTTGT